MPPPDPAQQRLATLSAAQKVGQLLMVGTPPAQLSPAAADAVTTYHVGAVMLNGRSSLGVEATAGVTAQIRALATQEATGGIGPFVATDQEGGLVQVLMGPGFSTIPDGPTQAAMPSATLQQEAATWGAELATAGVNVDLAPVLDLVAPGTVSSNAPVGALDRNLGTDAETVSAHGTAFIAGMAQSGVSTTVKHFPGLGRVTANTDTSAAVVDQVTTTSDPSLGPFAAGIQAGAGLVMVSLATYTLIDPTQPAVFSPTVITTLLRGQLGYGGVVITDDVGAADQVSGVAPGERATRFVDAGGDLVLTVDAGVIPEMVGAVAAKMASDSAFAAKVDAAVLRILTAKKVRGLW